VCDICKRTCTIHTSVDTMSVLQCVAVCCSVCQSIRVETRWVCCSVLQGVRVCCSVLQCVAVSCSVLQCLAILNVPSSWAIHTSPDTKSVLQCAAVCCSVLQCVAVCWVCCSVRQCVARVLQCVAIIKVPSSWAIHTNQETKGVQIHRAFCSAQFY